MFGCSTYRPREGTFETGLVINNISDVT